MAKKKNKNGAASMDISTDPLVDLPLAMDTSEGRALTNPAVGVVNRKIKKVPVKRSKNLRKLKAIEKAISKSEKSEVKISKNKSKILRIQSAKSLYD